MLELLIRILVSQDFHISASPAWLLSPLFGLECQGVNGKVQNALTQTMHVWSSSIYFPNTKILQQNIAVVGQEVVFAITMTTSDDQPIALNITKAYILIAPSVFSSYNFYIYSVITL
jgi:hypothetical protein